MNRLPLLLSLFLAVGVSPCTAPAARAQTAPVAPKKWVETKVTKRVALVMGNAAYQSGSKLSNPANDATAMAKVLRSLGFEVIVVIDGTRRQMLDAIDAFGNKLSADCVALCFYSGHGLQIGGTNYLLPVDFDAKARADVEYEAVAADRILGRFDERGSAVNLLILDACRNNPFRGFTRSAERGLTRMDAPRGTLIAYATAPGSVADDNANEANGLYTKELLKRLPAPGVKVQDVFQSVLEDVTEASGGKQRPYVESSIVGRLYLAGGELSAPKLVVNTNTKPAPVVPISPMDTKARLSVTTNVPGATISVDGAIAAKGAYSVNLLDETEKSVTVKITAPNFEGQLVPVTLKCGTTVPLSVTLEPAANAVTVRRVSLVYKATQGRKRRSRITGTIRFTGADGSSNTLTAESVGTLTFSKIKPNGEITIQEKTDSMIRTLNGQTVPDEEAGNDLPTSYTITKIGEIVSAEEDNPADNEYFAVRLQAASVIVLPGKPVGEGDKWSHDYVVNKKLGTRAAHADFQLIGFETIEGVETPQVKIAYKEIGTDIIVANGTSWLELSSGDVVRGDISATGLPLLGLRANGIFHSEKLSGSALAP